MNRKESKSKSSQLPSSGTLSYSRFYVFIIVACFILYGNSIKNGFSLDDEFVTYNHVQVKKGFKGIPEIFTTFYTEGSNTKQIYGYRPIAKATFAIEYAIFGENPHISHFINILIYALTGCIIFLTISGWFKDYNIIFPFLITMLFLAHPIHSEVVLSLKNRDVLIAFLGSFTMFHFAIKYIEHDKIKHIILATFFGIFSFLSKPETAPSVFLIPFLSYFFTKATIKRSIIVPLIPWLFTAVFILALQLLKVPVIGRSSSAMEYYDNPLFFTSNWDIRLGVAFNSLFYYMKMLVVHYPLVYFYGYNMIPIEGILNFVPVLSLLFYLGIGFFALIKLKIRHPVSLGIIWYLIHIALFSNIFVPAAGIVAERFLFAGSFGFCIVLAYYILKISKVNFQSISNKPALNSTFVILSFFIFLFFTGQTISRNNDWKDKLTLFRHDIQYLENSVKAHETLAASLMYESNSAKTNNDRFDLIEEAAYHYKRTIEIHPDFAMGNNNVGMVYANFYNECDKAIPLYLKAIKIDSGFGEAMINLGECYSRLERVDEAIQILEKGIKIEKGKTLDPYMNLISMYFKKAKIDSAVNLYNESLIYFPKSELLNKTMGNHFLSIKDTSTAIKYFSISLSIKPETELSNFVNRHNSPK